MKENTSSSNWNLIYQLNRLKEYKKTNNNKKDSFILSSFLTKIFISLLYYTLICFFLMLQFFLITFLTFSNIIYLVCISIRQILCRKKKIFPRTGSGFLNNKQNINEKTQLIIKLEETLIFISDTKIEGISQFLLINNRYIYKRPFYDIFINSLSQYTDIIIYSDKENNYINNVIDGIDKNKKIKKIYSSIKDLSYLRLNTNNFIIIDHLYDSHFKHKGNFYFNIDKIISISPWNGKHIKDDSLLKLKNILQNNFCSGYINEIRDIVDSCNCNDI